MHIAEQFYKIRQEVPDNITILAAVKKRTPEEIREIIGAGILDIGHNYVQEAETTFNALEDCRDKVNWHMIGHLQKNKINKALAVCNTIQTVDSEKLAIELDKRYPNLQSQPLSVLIEVNSGRESVKAGINPDLETVLTLAKKIAMLPNLKLKGLMTMGPFVPDPEELRPFFRKVGYLYSELKNAKFENTDVNTLSMGMSGSWRVAVEEGSTMIRLGTVLFGPR